MYTIIKYSFTCQTIYFTSWKLPLVKQFTLHRFILRRNSWYDLRLYGYKITLLFLFAYLNLMDMRRANLAGREPSSGAFERERKRQNGNPVQRVIRVIIANKWKRSRRAARMTAPVPRPIDFFPQGIVNLWRVPGYAPNLKLEPNVPRIYAIFWLRALSRDDINREVAKWSNE